MSAFFKKSKKRKKLEKEGLATSKTRLKQDQTIGHAINKSKFISVIILALVWAFSATLLIIPDKQNFDFYLVVNQLAPKTIYSNFDFIYLDKDATKLKQEKAKRSIPLIFEIESEKCAESLAEANNIFKIITSGTLPEREKLEKRLSSHKITILPTGMQLKKNKYRENIIEKLGTVLYKGVISPELIEKYDSPDMRICIVNKDKQHYRVAQPVNNIYTPETAAMAFANIVAEDYTPENRKEMKQLIHNLALLFIEPNLKYNQGLTTLEQNIVIASDKNNVYREVKKSDIIVKKGEKVSSTVLDKLYSYEKEKVNREVYSDFWENFAYNIIISLMIVSVTGLYFFYLYPSIFHSNQKMGITATVIIISLIGIFLANKIFHVLAGEYNLPISLCTCLLPLGLTAVLLSVLTGVRTATFSSLLVALVAAVKLDNVFVVILGMAISCVAGYLVHDSKNYKKYYIKTVLAVSLIYIVVAFFGLFNLVIHDFNIAGWIVLFSIINGLITGVVSLGLLFVLESLFQISTDMSLLSLCDYNHPLLKRLQLEAPGTYHHSLIVATLAEQAAGAIGANPLRARVFALFHDIGKLAKPDYFTENNPDSSSRHFALKPAMSSMVILNHVKEGVNLALKYKLSRKIRDAIEQHHGTDIVYFFYKRALEESDGKNTVTENEYRYSGPKPKEKEIVLVSIADSCEAASRSLAKPTPSKIETLVWEIIRKKVREGQLDNADLTFMELAKAKESIIKTLNSMLHTRISYTPEEENDNEGDLFKAATENITNQEETVQENGSKNNGIGKA
jgi:cyclic-di-AMP phosphodiesterase PgpH